MRQAGCELSGVQIEIDAIRVGDATSGKLYRIVEIDNDLRAVGRGRRPDSPYARHGPGFGWLAAADGLVEVFRRRLGRCRQRCRRTCTIRSKRFPGLRVS